MKRPGFALLAAILIAAFLLAAMAGIGATLTSQVRSQAQAGSSRTAFYGAEAALQHAFLAACNTSDTDPTYAGIHAYLAAGSSPLAWQKVVLGSDPRTFTWVKAKPIFGTGKDDSTVLRYEFVAEGVVCDRVITASQASAGTGFNVVARRVIKLVASGLSAQDAGSVFNFGMFAGSSISQTGKSAFNGSPRKVSIYSGGSFTMTSGASSVSNIDVSAHGTITVKGTLTQSSELEHARELTAPVIDLAYWQGQFNAFLGGSQPYDGSDSQNYMNTAALFNGEVSSTDLVKNHIQKILGHPAPASDPTGNKYARPQDVATLCADLAGTAPSGALAGMDLSVYQQLQKTLFRTVFYVEDAGLLNATIPGGDVSGVLVCPGTLTFTTKDVGSGAVYLSKGDLTFNGSGTIMGTFYTDGSQYTSHGSTPTLVGSIIAPRGSITFDGANKDVTFQNFAFGNTELDEHFQAVEAMSSGWSETDYTAFTTF
jgi:type II secretory pathway pseudopilin PulG